MQEGEDNIYELNDYSKLYGNYNIVLSLIRVADLDESFLKTFQNEMGSIQISHFELVFSNMETITNVETQNRMSITSTDCFSKLVPESSFSTKRKALSYLMKCASLSGVVPSLVPRGELFTPALFYL